MRENTSWVTRESPRQVHMQCPKHGGGDDFLGGGAEPDTHIVFGNPKNPTVAGIGRLICAKTPSLRWPRVIVRRWYPPHRCSTRSAVASSNPI
jgi:hypothetical protein